MQQIYGLSEVTNMTAVASNPALMSGTCPQLGEGHHVAHILLSAAGMETSNEVDDTSYLHTIMKNSAPDIPASANILDNSNEAYTDMPTEEAEISTWHSLSPEDVELIKTSYLIDPQ